MVINARRESLAGSRLWRPLVENDEHRCLVPADGFYEWRSRGAGRSKQPYLFELADGGPFAFAGLWRGGSGDEPPECVIVTCEANDLVAGVHDRMPVMLGPSEADQWVGSDDAQAQAVLKPLDSTAMRVRPVSTSVNSSRRDDPELLTEPVDKSDDPRGSAPDAHGEQGTASAQDSLFAD
jgi:putative SOS response-associated peptidase YedK